MIKMLSKLSLRKRALVYSFLVAIVFLASVFIGVAVGLRFDTDSAKKDAWFFFCAVVASVVLLILSRKFDKWEENFKVF